MLCKCKLLKHVCGHVIKWVARHRFSPHRCTKCEMQLLVKCVNVFVVHAMVYFAYKEQIIELLDHRQNGFTQSVSQKTSEHDIDANVFQHIFM